MATKNLETTVVDGGNRAKDVRIERRKYNRGERHAIRARLATMTKMGEWDDDPKPYSTSRYYVRDFQCRIIPLYRWLDRQAGRNWDEIYSDLCRNFDRRTWAWHHLRGHLRYAVESWSEFEFWIKRFDHVPYGKRRVIMPDGTLRIFNQSFRTSRG